jgi:ABC-type iron transport system FetAB ATPase subunit
MRAPLLEVGSLEAYYGKSHILHGVTFYVGEGEIVGLIGRNGVGRSTTIKAIMGDVRSRGSVRFRGEEIAGLKPHQTALKGLGYVPETRDIFPDLTVRQNLQLGEKAGKTAGRWAMADMLRMFPQLEERAEMRAGVLSGGEQQMLTICRTLMGDPDLVMIRRADGRPLADDGRACRPPTRGDRQARRRHPADRAKANDRSEDRPSALRHGTRENCLRRHVRRSRSGRGHSQRMAGSVNGNCALCTLPFGPARSSTSSRASVIPDGEQVACGNLSGMATMNLAARRRGDPRMFWTRPTSNSVATLVRRSFGGLGAAPRTSTTKIGASFGPRLSRSSAVLRTSTNTQSSPPPIAEAHWQLAACLRRPAYYAVTAICAPEKLERRLEST